MDLDPWNSIASGDTFRCLDANPGDGSAHTDRYTAHSNSGSSCADTDRDTAHSDPHFHPNIRACAQCTSVQRRLQ